MNEENLIIVATVEQLKTEIETTSERLISNIKNVGELQSAKYKDLQIHNERIFGKLQDEIKKLREERKKFFDTKKLLVASALVIAIAIVSAGTMIMYTNHALAKKREQAEAYDLYIAKAHAAYAKMPAAGVSEAVGPSGEKGFLFPSQFKVIPQPNGSTFLYLQ